MRQPFEEEGKTSKEKQCNEAKNSRKVRPIGLDLGRAAEAGPKSAPKSHHRLVHCARGRYRHAPTPFGIRVRSFTKILAQYSAENSSMFYITCLRQWQHHPLLHISEGFKLYCYKSFRLLKKLENDLLQCGARIGSGKAPVSCYHPHAFLGA